MNSNAVKPFVTCLVGRVLLSGTFTEPCAAPSVLRATCLRVIAKQDCGTIFETVQLVGLGPDAETRALIMRGRLRAGARIQAHGSHVTIVSGPAQGEPPRLLLHNTEFIRSEPAEPPHLALVFGGTESATAARARAPTPDPRIAGILQRMAERHPAIARGLPALNPHNTAGAINHAR